MEDMNNNISFEYRDALEHQHENDYPKTSYVDKNGNVCHVLCCGEQCDIYYACCTSDQPLCVD